MGPAELVILLLDGEVATDSSVRGLAKAGSVFPSRFAATLSVLFVEPESLLASFANSGAIGSGLTVGLALLS